MLLTSRIVVVQDSSCWAATPETARGSTRSALTTAPASRVVNLARAGSWTVASVNVRRRVLAQNAQVKERRRQARHPARVRPELVATGPGQVYTWDITKLAGPVKGTYYDAYVMIDIYSRYIVGVRVHHYESAPLAEEMMKEV